MREMAQRDAPSMALALGLAVVLGALANVPRLGAMERYLATSGYEDHYYLPAPDWLVPFSLGHREALADLVWLRALVYYGDEFVDRGDVEHVFDYAEAMLALDPDFRAVYAWIGTAGVYRPQDVTAEDVGRAIDIMERGVARFPDDGELAWEVGATLAFELPHLQQGDRAAQDRSRERGATYLMRASELGAAPAYAVLTSASLLARVGRAELAASHLEEMYAVTSDPDLRAEIAARIESIRSESFGRAFVEENARFEDRWSREMPYAPASLYFLAGPVPVIDVNAGLRDGFAAHVLDDQPLSFELAR
jgi:hypothetical protein